jgi:PIN domain nuclease of toxin-antitoxin system
MSYLLDTHVFLWAAFSPDKLSVKARKVIKSSDNRVCVSVLSFWEVSLKFALGKIVLENCMPDDLPRVAERMNIEIIHPTAQETASFYRLPKVAHKDPFDRMIIWQAIQQPMVLVSKDANFPEYEKFGLRVIW